jgi:hypothetical protein
MVLSPVRSVVAPERTIGGAVCSCPGFRLRLWPLLCVPITYGGRGIDFRSAVCSCATRFGFTAPGRVAYSFSIWRPAGIDGFLLAANDQRNASVLHGARR